MNFRSVAAVVSCYCFIIVAAVIGLGLGALLLLFVLLYSQRVTSQSCETFWELLCTWPMNLPTWLTSTGKFFSFKFCPLVKTSSSCKHYWSHWPGRVPCMHACAKYLLNLICNLNVLRIWTCLKQNLWSLIYHWWVELLFVFLVEFLFTLWLILI